MDRLALTVYVTSAGPCPFAAVTCSHEARPEIVHRHSRAVLMESVPTVPSAATVGAERLTVAAQRPGTGVGARTELVVLELQPAVAVASAMTKLKVMSPPGSLRMREPACAMAEGVPCFPADLNVFNGC